MILHCPNCQEETPHHEVDHGFGYTEYGSHGSDHIDIVAECQKCGIINPNYDGGDFPI